MIKIKDLENLQGGFSYGRIYLECGSDVVELVYSYNMGGYRDYLCTVYLTEEQFLELEVISMDALNACVGCINIRVRQN